MSEQHKTGGKPPKKLVPRPAENDSPAAAPATVEAPPVAPVAEVPAVAPAETPAKAAKPRRKRDAVVEETVARHQAVLAEALKEAQAIKYDTPPLPAEPRKAKAEKAEKADKGGKAKKPKLVRDSYAMPESEYARIGELKKRLAGLGREAKKSELLRAGIALLAALNDAELQAVMAGVERIKTGRPAK